MIVLPPTFVNSAVEKFFHTKHVVAVERGVIQSPSACCFTSCGLDLPAFANLNDTGNTRENDFFNFTISVPKNYVVEGTLTDIKTGNEYLIIDQTFGTFNDVGTIAGRLDLWGFVLDWTKVANEIGFGRYKFTTVIKDNGDNTRNTLNSPCFHLDSFDCEAAHGTVRISASQSGYIQNRFDWSGIEGDSQGEDAFGIYGRYQIRLHGRLNRTGVTTNSDFLSDSSYRESLIQKQTFNNWVLGLNWVKYVISDVLLNEMFLANPVFIDDYNMDNITTFDQVVLKHIDNDDPEKFDGLKDEFFKINLEDYDKSNIKRYN